jgi:hypothetical protein
MASSTLTRVVDGSVDRDETFGTHHDLLYDPILKDEAKSKEQPSATTSSQPFHLLPLAQVQKSDDEFDDTISGGGARPRIAHLDVIHGIGLVDRVLSHREW